MIIKSFTAESASAAMKLVRREMGGEAIVLKTRQVVDSANRPRVEITACLEKASVAQASTILADERSSGNRLPREFVTAPTESRFEAAVEPDMEPQPKMSEEPVEQAGTADDGFEENAAETVEEVIDDDDRPTANTPATAPSSISEERFRALEQKIDRLTHLTLRRSVPAAYGPRWQPIIEAMQRADLPNEFIEDFVLEHAEIRTDKFERTVMRLLVDRFSELMAPELKLKPGHRVLFTGLPGAGKSSVMGKLATRLVAREKRRIRLAGLDFQKVGAHEELAGYADLLAAEVTEAKRDAESRDKADRKTITLIDAPGLPAGDEARQQYAQSVKAAEADYRIVVVSALTRTADVMDLAAALTALEPTHIAGTMLDGTPRSGAIITAALKLEAKIVFISDSAGGAGTLHAPDPAALVRSMLAAEVSGE